MVPGNHQAPSLPRTALKASQDKYDPQTHLTPGLGGARLQHDPPQTFLRPPNTALPLPSSSRESLAPSIPPLVYLLQPSLRPSVSLLLSLIRQNPNGLGLQTEMGVQRARSPREWQQAEESGPREISEWDHLRDHNRAAPQRAAGWDQTRARSKASVLLLCHLYPHQRRDRRITATGFICIKARGCYQPGPSPAANKRPSHGVGNKIHDSPLREEGACYRNTRKPNHRRQCLRGEGLAVPASPAPHLKPAHFNF